MGGHLNSQTPNMSTQLSANLYRLSTYKIYIVFYSTGSFITLEKCCTILVNLLHLHLFMSHNICNAVLDKINLVFHF